MLQILEGEPPANTPPVRRELPPGSRFRYSGSHYAVLQQLLTDAMQRPFDELMTTVVLDLATAMLTPQVPGGFAPGAEVVDGRFGHTGQNTGYSCFSFAWPVSGTAVAVMTNAEDCRDTLVALIELARRHFG